MFSQLVDTFMVNVLCTSLPINPLGKWSGRKDLKLPEGRCRLNFENFPSGKRGSIRKQITKNCCVLQLDLTSPCTSYSLVFLLRPVSSWDQSSLVQFCKILLVAFKMEIAVDLPFNSDKFLMPAFLVHAVLIFVLIGYVAIHLVDFYLWIRSARGASPWLSSQQTESKLETFSLFSE